ncbi:MAG: hypothetical protein AABW83_02675 [Nanoarchaeota archaeon]
MKKKNSKPKEKKKLKFKIELEKKENKDTNSEENIKFKRLSLEEIIPSLKENNENINRIERRINIEKEEEQKETPIYDINNSIKKTGYHSIADYSSSQGNYDMIQKAGEIKPIIKDSEQPQFNQDQIKNYETPREKELKERRKMW